jgi:hypothetical protein
MDCIDDASFKKGFAPLAVTEPGVPEWGTEPGHPRLDSPVRPSIDANGSIDDIETWEPPCSSGTSGAEQPLPNCPAPGYRRLRDAGAHR